MFVHLFLLKSLTFLTPCSTGWSVLHDRIQGNLRPIFLLFFFGWCSDSFWISIGIDFGVDPKKRCRQTCCRVEVEIVKFNEKDARTLSG